LALSRNVHLNPVRIQALGLGKRDRPGQRLGMSPAPDATQLQEGFSGTTVATGGGSWRCTWGGGCAG